MSWIVGVGGMVGAICRYLLAVSFQKKKTSFPYGTWLANLTGSFILGFVFAMYSSGMLSERLWLLLGIGFLGSYTTMSTFGYETMSLLQKRKYRIALVYVLTSLILGICFAWAGWQCYSFL